MKLIKSPLFLFAVLLLAIAAMTSLGPEEATLGKSVRIVYLHGVWVWAAMAVFILAGGAGVLGLILKKDGINRWSRALGRTGLFFWITYLPISMWAMQANWNGLFLAEPRWRVALVFSIGGLLLQIGLYLLEDPRWASLFNFLFVVGLWFAVNSAEQVMHPPSPIFDSNATQIQIFFIALLSVTLLASTQVARWFHQFEVPKATSNA